MRNIVLAIAVIGCLDLAFMAYMRSNSRVISTTQLSSYEVAAITLPDLTPTEAGFETSPVTFGADRIQPRRRTFTEVRQVRYSAPAIRVTVRRAETSPVPETAIRKVPFLETRPLPGVVASTETPSISERRPEKRSIVSRVTPVVKKPVNWFKTAISKLF